MADDKILQHSHYKEEPVPRLEEAQLSYPQWLTKMHQIHRGEDPLEVPASISTSVDAFVNAGRWLWMCVACNSAITAEAGQPSICVECATQGWVNVVFPSNREEVEAELLKQPGHRAHAPIRQWRPGWGMSVLEDRTAKAQESLDAGVPFPTSLSIGATRVWSVGEILTAANKNTYERTVLEDLAGRNGPVEYEGAIVIDSLTTTERNAITLTGTGGLSASGNGLVIYNSTKAVFERYENGAWREFTDLANLTIASAARGDVFFRGATAIQRLGAGTARQIFRTGGTGADPLWNDLLGTRIANTTTQGSVIYEDSNGRLARLTPPTNAGAVLETGGSNADPIWSQKATYLNQYTTPGSHTWTPPSGTRFAYAEVISGGGGGGSGASRTGAGQAGGGGVGGGGGGRVRSTGIFFHITLAANFTVVVGGGGAGGAAVTGAAGNAGTAGGTSTFGIGTGAALTTSGGGGGTGGLQSGTTAAGGAAGTNGGTSAAGGGGTGATVINSSIGITGGAGGSASGPSAAGGAGGIGSSSPGSAGAANTNGAGGGGGGGGNNGGVIGGAGGAGGAPGGGGGGGAGSARVGSPRVSGTGGAGVDGAVRIWSW